MSHLYVIDDQDWSWLTYAQMVEWHKEDEEWLKARAAEAFESARRYYSTEAMLDRLMERARAHAYTELMRDLAHRRGFGEAEGPEGPDDGPMGPAMH